MRRRNKSVLKNQNGVFWTEIMDKFEKEMAQKLKNLPGHMGVSENLKEFRNVISHELPENVPSNTFRKLIKILLQNKPIDAEQIRKVYLEPLLRKENKILDKNKAKFRRLKLSARKWVKNNLSEEELQKLWKEHKTWLPRRYTIYKNPNVSFQKIAADTLARFALINHWNIV